MFYSLQKHVAYLLSDRSPLWPKVRRDHLQVFPMCAACGGEKNLEVHHLKPYHLYPQLELNPANLITLCEVSSRNCHYRIGHCFDWKAYNPHCVEDAALSLLRINNKMLVAVLSVSQETKTWLAQQCDECGGSGDNHFGEGDCPVCKGSGKKAV